MDYQFVDYQSEDYQFMDYCAGLTARTSFDSQCDTLVKVETKYDN